MDLKNTVSEHEDILLNVSNELLKDIEEYERREFSRRSKNSKRRYPSNRDVVEAIKEITGGLVSRYMMENLYDAIKGYLEEKGFEVSALNEKRVWRLVLELVKKKHIKLVV